MKHILYALLAAFLFSNAFAQEHSAQPVTDLEKIVELFLVNSTEDALIQLNEKEDDIVDFVRGSNDAAAYMLLGRAYFYAEQDQKAIEEFKSALGLDPSLADAYYFIGLIQRYARDLEGAKGSFLKAIEANNRDKSNFVELGRTLEMMNDMASAIDAYQNALALNKSDFASNSSLATIYAKDGNIDYAERHYLAALEAKPTDVDSHYNLGQLYQIAKRHEAAISQFERVLELKPDDWSAITKLVQENEAVKNYAKRDRAIELIYDVWRSDAGEALRERGFYIRDQIDVENGKLFALEYFELNGDRPRKYVFNLQDSESGEVVFTVSLGSYGAINRFARATGNISADARRYHLDGYGSDGSHYTFAFFDELPSYAVVKELTLKALSGELRALSSSMIKE